MYEVGEAEKEVIKPEFNHSVQIDFKGAEITSDTGVLKLSEVDERFGIIGPMEDDIDDSRSPRHTRHTIIQMIRQRGLSDRRRCKGGLTRSVKLDLRLGNVGRAACRIISVFS